MSYATWRLRTTRSTKYRCTILFQEISLTNGEKEQPEWTINLRNQFAKVLDGMHSYDNLLGFIAGNEVITNASQTPAAPVVKAAIADMKAYRDLMPYRKIPIGYASADSAEIRFPLQDFLDCGNETIAADFFSLARFSWCGDSGFQESGYDILYDFAVGYDIPLFLSETGCTAGGTSRDFADQDAVLGRDMNDQFSGSIIYAWRNDSSGFGIVQYPNGQATGTPSLSPEYTSLKSRWSTLNPVGISSTAYNPSGTRRACPQSSSRAWLVEARLGTELPTLGLSGLEQNAQSLTSGLPRSSGAAGSGAGGSESSGGSGLGAGPIAGIVVGIVGLLVIIGVVLLCLRRKKKKQQTEFPATAHDNNAFMKPELDGSNKDFHTHSTYPEVADSQPIQEIDARHGHSTHPELGGNNTPSAVHHSQPSELPHQHGQWMQHPQEIDDVYAHESQQSSGATAAEPSPHVQAQRRREMEWLEMEEARIRQQRELLMQQEART